MRTVAHWNFVIEEIHHDVYSLYFLCSFPEDGVNNSSLVLMSNGVYLIINIGRIYYETVV